MSDHWCWSNLIDAQGVAITAISGESGTLSASLLRDPRVGKIWRSGTMPAELRVALPATSPISVVGLFGANITAMGEIEILLGTSLGAGDVYSELVDTSLLSGTQLVTLIRGTDGALAPVEAGFLTIKATGAVPLQIGRLWAGEPDWSTRVGHIINGSQWQVIDLSIRNPTMRNGAFLIDRAARRRIFAPAYDALYPEEYQDALYTMDVEKGLSAQMLFVPNPDVYPAQRWAILGYLRELPENRFVGYLRGSREMSIVEAG